MRPKALLWLGLDDVIAFCGRVLPLQTSPFGTPRTIVCLPHLVDYESISSPLIAVKRGKITERVQIQCRTPADKQGETKWRERRGSNP